MTYDVIYTHRTRSKVSIGITNKKLFSLVNHTKEVEGNKEMFYLTPHSKHFIYGYMVKDRSDSERGNPLPPLNVLLFPISSKGSFKCIAPTYRIAHTTAFVKPVVEHWLEQEIAQWIHHEVSI